MGRWNRRKLLGMVAAGGGVVAGTAMSGRSTWATGTARSAHQLDPRILATPPEAGAWVELDGGAIAANLRAVRAAAGGRPVMGVVKANGYGHGLVPMARVLTEAGVDSLMVITVDEALAIREVGITTPVLNYGPFDRGAAEDLVLHGIDQAVYTTEAVEGMAAAARRVAGRARLQVVLDTGLGRVGVSYTAAADVLSAAAEVASRSEVTITGTATALTEDPDVDRLQLERYRQVCDAARVRGIDIGAQYVASSAAVLDFPESHLDMVRPGIMLYGHYPNDRSMRDRPIDLTPVLSLRAKVAYVKTLQRGETIGYHGAWTAERATTVATLPIGHSEGYPAGALAAGGVVEVHGRSCELVGGITSNHLEIRIPEGLTVRVGDVATLIAGGEAAKGAALERRERAALVPTVPRVGEWGGAGVYGTLMHVSPLLPRVIT
jgi:alanine racemase